MSGPLFLICVAVAQTVVVAICRESFLLSPLTARFLNVSRKLASNSD